MDTNEINYFKFLMPFILVLAANCYKFDNSTANILDAFDVSQVNSPKNKSCRNNLSTCKALANKIIQKYQGTRWESEAQKTSDAVVNKYDQFCNSPVEEETK